MSNDFSPLTDDLDINWDDPNQVFEVVFFRVTSDDEDWDNDPASSVWDLSREEAATRLDAEDYSNPFS